MIAYGRNVNLGTWIAIGVAIGVAMWLATDNAVFLGAGIAIGIALGLAGSGKDGDDDDKHQNNGDAD